MQRKCIQGTLTIKSNKFPVDRKMFVVKTLLRFSFCQFSRFKCRKTRNVSVS